VNAGVGRQMAQERRLDPTRAREARMCAFLFVGMCLSGCGAPDDARLLKDFSVIYPGCALRHAAGGETNYGWWNLWPDDVWIEVSFKCEGYLPMIASFNYRKDASGEWHLITPSQTENNSRGLPEN
jgi:hypothetical protein